jgi:hypothetical protein
MWNQTDKRKFDDLIGSAALNRRVGSEYGRGFGVEIRCATLISGSRFQVNRQNGFPVEIYTATKLLSSFHQGLFIVMNSISTYG